MPSPRAVLADITDLKLDPTKAHRHTKASGRLSHGTSPVVDQPELKALESTVRPTVTVETVTSEQPQDVANAKSVEQSTEPTDESQKKPPMKKMTKKDKAEEPPAAGG